MKPTKPLAKYIKAQIQMLDDDEQAAQEAAKAATARRSKQKAQLLEILDAVECENLTPKEIELRRLHKRTEK
jgi:hypothetical protein